MDTKCGHPCFQILQRTFWPHGRNPVLDDLGEKDDSGTAPDSSAGVAYPSTELLVPGTWNGFRHLPGTDQTSWVARSDDDAYERW